MPYSVCLSSSEGALRNNEPFRSQLVLANVHVHSFQGDPSGRHSSRDGAQFNISTKVDTALLSQGFIYKAIHHKEHFKTLPNRM